MYTNHDHQYNTAFNKLNEKQLKAVECTEGPVLCVAGPGAGKSSVLAVRVCHILKERDVNPGNILCLTFTKAGVKSMKKKLNDLIGEAADKIDVFTFHAFSDKLIKQNSSQEWTNKRLITNTERFLLLEELCYKYIKEEKESGLKPASANKLSGLSKIVSLFKQEGLEREEIQNYARACIYNILPFDTQYYSEKKKEFTSKGITRVKKINEFADEIYSLYEEYCERLELNNWIEYEDMIVEALLLLNNNQALLQQLQEKYLYILVDEFQDTNKKQLAILDKLVSGVELPNIFAVGDEDQCIYKFQGASHLNFEWMKRKFLGHLTTIVLNVNYRSTTLLLQEVHNLICDNSNRHQLKKDPMIAGNEDYAKIIPLTPTFKSYENAEQESYAIAHSIKSQIDSGKKPSEIAVLVRRHSDYSLVQKWLTKFGIPSTNNLNENNLSDCVYGKSIFYLIQFIRLQGKNGHFADAFLLQFLLLKATPNSIIKSYLEYYGNKQIGFYQWLSANSNTLESFSAIKSGIDYLLNNRNKLVTSELREKINETVTVGISKFPQTKERQTWEKYLNDFCDTNNDISLLSLAELMWYEHHYGIKISIDADEKEENENAVILSTIHGSKGLEYDVVYLMSCHSNNWENRDKKGGINIPVPLDQFIAPEQDDYEDMRRLIYVACTRAKLELHVSSFRKYPAGDPLFNTTLLDNFGKQSQINLHYVDDFELPVDIGDKYIIRPTTDLQQLFKAKVDSFAISPTSLNAWLACQNEFFYTQVLKLTNVNNQFGLFGTIVHNVLQAYAEDKNRQLTQEYISSLIEQEFAKRDSLFYPPHVMRYKQFGVSIILKYLVENPINTKPDYSEVNFNASIASGPKIKGKIDRIDRKLNSLYVIDYKTALYPTSLKSFENLNNPGTDYWRQAMLYKILMKENFQNIEEINVEFHYLNDKLSKSKFHFENNHVFELWLKEVWDSVHKMEFNKRCENAGCVYCSINA